MPLNYFQFTKQTFTNLVQNSSKLVALLGLSVLTLTSFSSNLQTKAQADLSVKPSLTTNPTAKLQTNSKTCPDGQFLLEYFNGTNLQGEVLGSRCEAKIDFNQAQNTAPSDKIWPPYNWSVRFTGKVNFEPGKYKFTMVSDDGSRLFIDEKKVIDSWKDQDGTVPTYYETELSGLKQIKMDYYQTGRGSIAKLSWEKTGKITTNNAVSSSNSSTSSTFNSQAGISKKTGYLRYIEGLEPITEDKKESKHKEATWSFIDIETKEEVYVNIPETLIKTKGGAYYLTKDKVEISYSQEDWDKALRDPKFLLNIIDIKPLGLPAVDPFLGNNNASNFWMGQYADKLGTQKYATIMCKFPDIAQLPTTQTRLNSIINGTTTNTLQDYFKKSSFGKLDFTADIYSNNNLWYTMPRPESFYTGPNFTALRDDCANAANADINFLNYDGIINIYNGETWDDNSAWGGPNNWMFLDGQWKRYGMTYIPPWVYRGVAGFYNMDLGAFAHEIGHSLGLPHSSSQNFDGSLNEYGSRWDLMSNSRVRINGNFVPSDLIAYYKDRLGWIADNKRSRILTSDSTVIEIDSNSNPQNNPNNFQVAYVKDNSNLPGTSQFETYSIESRFFRDYDQNLAGNNLQESVVIHKISSFGGSDRRAILTTSLTAQSGNNNFATGSGNLNIRVCEKKIASFVVAINSVCPGSIGDQVWEDLNGNNLKDIGENGVNGITVNLVNQAGNAVTDINNQPIVAQTTQTVGAVQGFYRFNNLRPGQYRVNFSNIPANMRLVEKTGNLIDPNNSDVNLNDGGQGVFATDQFTLSAGQNIDYVDAGLRKKSGILGNKVWEDLNGNNLQDAGEPGIDGVIVSLTDQNGQPVRDVDGVIIPNQTTATVNGELGIYNFSKLPDGNTVNVGGQALQYIVKFSNLPANMKPVTKTGNMADPNNSDINPNLQTDPLALLFWENSQGTIDSVDAGFRRDVPNTLMVWGGNYAGELGVGSSKKTYSPTPVINGKDIKKVVPNNFSTIILKNDGTVWTVGMNNCGWLGNGQYRADYCGENTGSPIDTSTPAKITFGNNVLIQDIAATYAIDTNGNVWGWSIPCIKGQSPLENGCDPNINPGVPRRVLSAPGVLLANMVSFNENTITSIAPYGITDSNKNNFGTNAFDTTGRSWELLGDYTKAIIVKNVAPGNFTWDLVSKSTGNYTLLKDGRLFETVNNTPVQIKPGTTFKDVAVSTHILALETSGRVWSKGFNICGQNGIGGTVRDKWPAYNSYYGYNVQVGWYGCWSLANFDHAANPPVTDFVLVKDTKGTGILSNIKSVSATGLQSIAMTNDGQVYVWGGSDYGIGLGENILQVSLPTLIPNISKVQKVITRSDKVFLIIQD